DTVVADVPDPATAALRILDEPKWRRLAHPSRRAAIDPPSRHLGRCNDKTCSAITHLGLSSQTATRNYRASPDADPKYHGETRGDESFHTPPPPVVEPVADALPLPLLGSSLLEWWCLPVAP